MRVSNFVFRASCLFLLHAGVATAALSEQTLVKGQATTLSTDYDVGDVAIADRGVADFMVSSDRRQVYLNAITPGRTTLTIWDVDGTKRDEVPLTVVSASLQQIASEAKAALGDIPGMTIRPQGGGVVIEGNVDEPEDFDLIAGFTRAHPGVRNRVTVASGSITNLANRIEAAIGIPTIHVRGVNGELILDGIAYTKDDGKRAEEIAHLYDPDIKNVIRIHDLDRRVGEAPLVQLDVYMMEIKKSALRRFGVTWAPGSFPKASEGNVASGGSGAGLLGEAEGTGRTLLGFVINLLPKLRLAREQGDARVLEHSSIIVKDGEKGELFSGTEVPFLNGEKTEFKQVGITVEAEPIAVGSSVDLKIAAKLSAPSVSLDGGIDLRRVTTTAVCPSGESLVLGNIVRDGDVKMKNRFPKDIDTSTALFSLVASRDFQSQRSEFVIFVMPTILAAPNTAEADLTRWLEREDDVIRDRSQGEYRQHLRDQGLLPERRSTSLSGRRMRRWH